MRVIENNISCKRILRIIKNLQKCEKYTGRCRSFDEIGLLLGISKQRVEEIQRSAFKKLRHPMNHHVLGLLKETYNDEETNYESKI